VGALVWLRTGDFRARSQPAGQKDCSVSAGTGGRRRSAGVPEQTLNGEWHLLRNITLPGRKKTDIHIVLVGPPGVWVLEVKALSGQYRNIGDRWEYRSGRRWRTDSSNPIRQANRNAAHLANFLRADHIKQWVSAVVVWANQDSELIVENPGASVWTLVQLPDEIGNLWDQRPLLDATLAKTVDKLSRLCPEGDRQVLASVGSKQQLARTPLEKAPPSADLGQAVRAAPPGMLSIDPAGWDGQAVGTSWPATYRRTS
jgi:hypothetical protein